MSATPRSPRAWSLPHATAWASLAICASPATALAQQDQADLAKQLANPIAALISVPFQANFDNDIGPLDDGSRLTVNVQPVIPVSLNLDWNLISRTIFPLITQDDVFPGAGDETGLGAAGCRDACTLLFPR